MSEDRGFTDKMKGEVKDRVGGATGDKETQAEGLFDKAVGKVKEVASDVKDVAADAADAVKDKAKDIAGDIEKKLDD